MPVTAPFEGQLESTTLRKLFADAISGIDFCTPDVTSCFHHVTVTFDHSLTEDEQSHVMGSLLAYQLEESEWLDINPGSPAFSKANEGESATTLTFQVNAIRLTESIRQMLL